MPDILIGNIRGPQGETGPANQVLAQTYDYCISDNGETIPSGPWQSTPPESEQGDWVWVRNTTTMQEGADVIMYAVGYHGRDGEFNGIALVDGLTERVQALEDRITPIDKGGTGASTVEGAKGKLGITALEQALERGLGAINDYTTATNLLRGTRKFKAGETTWIDTNKYDGFYIPSTFSITPGDDGFSVAHVEASGLSSDSAKAIASSVVFGVKVGDVYTFSFDVMCDDVSQFTASPIGRIQTMDDKGAIVESYDVSFANMNISPISGKWYRIVMNSTITNSKSIALKCLGRLQRNGSLNFRKFSLNKLKAANALWAESPFDIDYINDITTGTNLIKCTRDCTPGTIANSLNPVVLDDGYSVNKDVLREKDSQGFTVLHLSATANTTIYGSAIGGDVFSPGEIITYAFEYMPINISSLSNATIGSITFYQEKTSKVSAGLALSNGSVSTNEWHKAVIHLQVPKEYNPDTWILANCFRWPASSEIKFRKACVYKGRIDKPEWNANPFDVMPTTFTTETFTQATKALAINRSHETIFQTSADTVNDTVGYWKGKPSGWYWSRYAHGQSAWGLICHGFTTATSELQIVQLIYQQDGTIKTRINVSSAQNTDAMPDFGLSAASITSGSLGYERGGTAANSLAGAKQNLGITALEARVTALESYL